MTKEKILKHKAVEDIYPQGDLIDGCKYIMELKEGYSWEGYGSVPVLTYKEAWEFLKDVEQI